MTTIHRQTTKLIRTKSFRVKATYQVTRCLKAKCRRSEWKSEITRRQPTARVLSRLLIENTIKLKISVHLLRSFKESTMKKWSLVISRTPSNLSSDSTGIKSIMNLKILTCCWAINPITKLAISSSILPFNPKSTPQATNCYLTSKRRPRSKTCRRAESSRSPRPGKQTETFTCTCLRISSRGISKGRKWNKSPSTASAWLKSTKPAWSWDRSRSVFIRNQSANPSSKADTKTTSLWFKCRRSIIEILNLPQRLK